MCTSSNTRVIVFPTWIFFPHQTATFNVLYMNKSISILEAYESFTLEEQKMISPRQLKKTFGRSAKYYII